MIEMSAGTMIEKSIAKWPINYLSKGCYLSDDSATKNFLVCSSGTGSE